MRFQPKTEHEIAMANIWPDGDYDFSCVEANDRISKKGSEMIEVKLRVFSSNGNESVVFDFLLEAMAHKLRHFCESTGLLSVYDRGDLTASDCIGRNGICRLGSETGGKYRPKNVVTDYIVKQRDIQRSPIFSVPDSKISPPPGIDPITGENYEEIHSGTPFD